MQVGSLVKHIELECLGILVKKSVYHDMWLIHWNCEQPNGNWCSECELEVIGE